MIFGIVPKWLIIHDYLLRSSCVLSTAQDTNKDIGPDAALTYMVEISSNSAEVNS